MNSEVVVINSRGQVVIPLKVRKRMGLKEGDALALTDTAGNLVMKRIKTPSREELLMEWNKLTKELNKKATLLGIKEEDVDRIIHERRRLDRLK
ncbi:MAG: AbrB/MazE/SpoVT family DNA-binding domain-containing protein [Candidatus Diapherotrites archaeon]|nr:AbrB/MazE/SpoVT family DNA-binding domain-containing protein [Candidatus Diapherotrites archaeon]